MDQPLTHFKLGTAYHPNYALHLYARTGASNVVILDLGQVLRNAQSRTHLALTVGLAVLHLRLSC